MSYVDIVFYAVGSAPYPVSSSSVYHMLRRQRYAITMKQVTAGLSQGKRAGWLTHDKDLGTYTLRDIKACGS